MSTISRDPLIRTTRQEWLEKSGGAGEPQGTSASFDFLLNNLAISKGPVAPADKPAEPPSDPIDADNRPQPPEARNVERYSPRRSDPKPASKTDDKAPIDEKLSADETDVVATELDDEETVAVEVESSDAKASDSDEPVEEGSEGDTEPVVDKSEPQTTVSVIAGPTASVAEDEVVAEVVDDSSLAPEESVDSATLPVEGSSKPTNVATPKHVDGSVKHSVHHASHQLTKLAAAKSNQGEASPTVDQAVIAEVATPTPAVPVDAQVEGEVVDKVVCYLPNVDQSETYREVPIVDQPVQTPMTDGKAIKAEDSALSEATNPENAEAPKDLGAARKRVLQGHPDNWHLAPSNTSAAKDSELWHHSVAKKIADLSGVREGETLIKAEQLSELRDVQRGDSSATLTSSTSTNPTITGTLSASTPTLVADTPSITHRRSEATHRPTVLNAAEFRRFQHRVEKAFELASQREGEIRLRLSPPHLGSLKVDLKMDGDTMHARLETETEAARQLIVDSLPGLRDRLSEQGIRIETFEVDLQKDRPFQQDRQSDQQPNQERPRQPIIAPSRDDSAPQIHSTAHVDGTGLDVKV